MITPDEACPQYIQMTLERPDWLICSQQSRTEAPNAPLCSVLPFGSVAMAQPLTTGQPSAAATTHTSHMAGIQRIDRDLATYAEVLNQNSTASDELRQDLRETCDAITALEQRILPLSKQKHAKLLDAQEMFNVRQQAFSVWFLPACLLAGATLAFASSMSIGLYAVPKNDGNLTCQDEVRSERQSHATQHRMHPIGSMMERDVRAASCDEFKIPFCTNCSISEHPDESPHES